MIKPISSIQSGCSVSQMGFDITIGNPPYVRADAGGQDQYCDRKLRRCAKRLRTANSMRRFMRSGICLSRLLNEVINCSSPAVLRTLIVSNAYCHAKYAQKSQKWFLKNSKILRLDFCGKVPLFGPVGVRNVIFLFQKTDGNNNNPNAECIIRNLV